MAAPRTPAAKVAKTPRRQARNGTPQSSQTAAAPSNYRHNWTAQQYWLLVQWLEENREYYMTKGPKWHDKYEHIREWLKPSDFGEVTGLSARYPELKGKDVPSTTNIESGLRYLKNGHTRRNGQLAKTGQGIDELSDVQILQNQNLIGTTCHVLSIH